MSRVEPLELRVGDERVLREWTRASSISAGSAQRARIVLLAAEGRSNVEIAALVGVSLPTVRSWRARYAGGGLDALGDLPRSGRPVVHDQSAVVAATLVAPPASLGVTHLVGAAARRAPGYQLRERGPDLAAVGPATVEGRDVQVQHRPGAGGQDPRRRRAVSGSSREGGRGLYRCVGSSWSALP